MSRQYVSLLMESWALLAEYWALLMECRSLFIESKDLFDGILAVLIRYCFLGLFFWSVELF